MGEGMIKVTDVAMKELKAIMDRGRTACVDEFKEISYGVDESNIALRLVLTPDGYLAIIMDVYREGDTVIEDNGMKVLLIEAELVDLVDGMLFDCADTPEGPHLQISTPPQQT
jgi:Fe-S cluster assembly iron-binding protein IscA